MNQLFKIDQSIFIRTVTLKVKDPVKVADYYERIGLKRLTETEREITLGISELKPPLLVLKKVKEPNPPRKVAGLFHTAFLLPERKDLGNVLYHLLSEQIPIEGASDHGYSEAVYLRDPEGNGIEIYSDKPKSKWDIKPNGRIAGITIEMDAEGVLASRDETATAFFPEQTIIGHVHLSVSSLEATQNFYEKILGMDLKDRFGEQANFFAMNGYHHHIGTNIWLGRNLPAPSEKDLGLEGFSIIVTSKEYWLNLKEQLKSCGVNVMEQGENRFAIIDPNGIKIKFLKNSPDNSL